jgi:hypothetical protein
MCIFWYRNLGLLWGRTYSFKNKRYLFVFLDVVLLGLEDLLIGCHFLGFGTVIRFLMCLTKCIFYEESQIWTDCVSWRQFFRQDLFRDLWDVLVHQCILLSLKISRRISAVVWYVIYTKTGLFIKSEVDAHWVSERVQISFLSIAKIFQERVNLVLMFKNFLPHLASTCLIAWYFSCFPTLHRQV